jgi:hypothetical protein
VNPLFLGLFDDAAIFPPGNVPLPEAVAAYRARRSPMVGPFVCSAARWDELVATAGDGPRLPVSLTLPGPDTPVPSAPGVRVVAVETPVAADDRPEFGGGLQAYAEISCMEITATRVAALRGNGLRLKIRTGGVRPEAFPGEADLARALWAAVRGGLAFKLTAGLHDPIRHRDPVTGFEHHGFLNVILATAQALQGYDIERALADQDEARVAAAVSAIDEPLAKLVRHHFVSFGTCSISEPVAGLRRLGLLPSSGVLQ